MLIPSLLSVLSLYLLISSLPVFIPAHSSSPFQTLFFLSTPTHSTHQCNGADFEEIKLSGKKRKVLACTCTVSLFSRPDFTS